MSSSEDGRSRSRSEKKRARIRRAAYVCFRDSGYHETTVDAICREAGISKGSFYWHYESKQEVFVDILETWTREVMDEVLLQFEEALSQPDRYTALRDALVREVHRGRAIVPLWLEFTVHARRDQEIQTAISRYYRRARAAIAEMMRPHVAGRFTEDEVQGVAAAIFAAYSGVVFQDLCDPQWASAERTIHQFMSVFRRIMLAYEATLDDEDDQRSWSPPDEAAPQGQRADPAEIDSLVGSYDEPVVTRVAALRRLVLRVAPEADEKVIAGWKVVAYSTDPGGLFAYIKPRVDEVHLGFYDGTELPDPNGILEGTGKKRRHVRLPTDEPLNDDPLCELVRWAYLENQ